MIEQVPRTNVLPGSKGDRTRQRIVSAARKVFGREGYFRTRMSDVAQAAGLSQGAIYRYFHDKDDLLLTVLRDHTARLFESSRAGRPFSPDPYEALYRANFGYFTSYQEEVGLARAFYQAAAADERYQILLDNMRTRFRARFLHVLERAAGARPGREVELLALALQCATEYFAYNTLAEGSKGIDPPVNLHECAEVVAKLWRAGLDGHLHGSGGDAAGHRG